MRKSFVLQFGGGRRTSAPHYGGATHTNTSVVADGSRRTRYRDQRIPISALCGVPLPNGNIRLLQLGNFKEFPMAAQGMRFEQRRSAPNGEDHLYVFFNDANGEYFLLSNNLITQEVATPTHCNGYCFFEDGELAYFQSDSTPQKHHTIQIWQTPYLDHNCPPPVQTDAYLYKIGNPAIVKAMAECQELLTLVGKEDSC